MEIPDGSGCITMPGPLADELTGPEGGTEDKCGGGENDDGEAGEDAAKVCPVHRRARKTNGPMDSQYRCISQGNFGGERGRTLDLYCCVNYTTNPSRRPASL